jgi:Flp pilus assembly protein TadG
LSVPVLITLASGVADWGFYLSRQVELQEVVRDAARYGVAATAPTTAARTHAQQGLTWMGVSSSTATITAQTSTDSTLSAQVLTLTVSLPYTAPVGLVPTPSTLTSRVIMLVEP